MQILLDASRRATRVCCGLGAVGALTLTLWVSAPRIAGASGGAKAAGVARFGLTGGTVFTDLAGKTYNAQEIAAHKATIFLFVSSQCPISNVYTPRFQGLANDYADKGVQVFAVYSDRQESRAEVAAHVRTHGITFPVIKDERNVLADRLGAQCTPQAILVDSTGTVRYRGRFDDNAVATRVTRHDLTDALDAILAGRPVAHLEVAAFGCAIRRASTTEVVAMAGVPTYAHDVAPILRAKCETCHHPGEVAPFTLQTYKQASAWAADIKRYTQNLQMPPWKPAPGYGEFANEHEMALTDQERATLAKWADGGAPLGNAKQIPPPRQFPGGWKLGEPDVILQPEREYHLSADGEDVYRNFVVKMDTSQDRWVSAVEVHPGNRAVVHHVLVYVDPLDASEKLEAQEHDGQPGYTSYGGGPGFQTDTFIGAWAPGNEAILAPDGLGQRVPKGALLVLQVHYHKDGKPETDSTQIGIHFSNSTVDKEIRNKYVANPFFAIPPGDPNHEVKMDLNVREASHLRYVAPHMHLLGRDMRVWAELPDHTLKPLIWIKDWDFNWQMTYALKTPLALPSGTKIHLVAHYDNSDNNLRNPCVSASWASHMMLSISRSDHPAAPHRPQQSIHAKQDRETEN